MENKMIRFKTGSGKQCVLSFQKYRDTRRSCMYTTKKQIRISP
nr:MAG TPA: hypothetical protein [Caudoviricetes sp.]